MTTRVSKLARELAPYIIDMVGTGGGGTTRIEIGDGGESTPLQLTHYSTHYNGQQYTNAGSTWDRTYDNVWVEVDVPTLFGSNATNTTDAGDCKIQVDLGQTYPELPPALELFTTGTFEILASSNKNNKSCFFALGIGGQLQIDTAVQVDFVTAGDVMQASFSWAGIVPDGTVLSIFAGSDADNTTLTFHDINFLVHGYARDYPVYIEGTGQQAGGMAVHDLDGPWHTGTLDEAQAPWAVTTTGFSIHTGDPNAHHPRDHAITGSTHVVTGLQYDIVGLPEDDTLGLLTPSSDISGGNTILISDASGDAILNALTANDDIAASGLQWDAGNGGLAINDGAPGGDTALRVAGAQAEDTTLQIKGQAAQIGHLLRITDSAGVNLIYVNADGDLISGSYDPHNAGWILTHKGDFEAENAEIRGTIKTAVFQADEVTATNGRIKITPDSGVLIENAACSGTGGTIVLKIKDLESVPGFRLFDVNDVLEFDTMAIEPDSGTALKHTLWDINAVGTDIQTIKANGWFTVSSYERVAADVDGLPSHWAYTCAIEQAPICTLRTGSAIVGYEHRVEVDSEWSTPGHIDINTVGEATPIIGVYTMRTDTPWDDGFTPHVKVGKIAGVQTMFPATSSIYNDEWGIVVGEDLGDNTKPHVVMTNKNMGLYNVRQEFAHDDEGATVVTGRIYPSGSISFSKDLDDLYAGGLRFSAETGNVTLGSSRAGHVVWDFENEALSVRGGPLDTAQRDPVSTAAGLYLTASRFGHWDGTEWKTKFESDGSMFLIATPSEPEDNPASGAGLFWDSRGGFLSGKDGVATQFSLSAWDGKIRAGAESVILDNTGVKIEVGADEKNRLSFFTDFDTGIEFASVRAEGGTVDGFASFGVENADKTALRIYYDNSPTGSNGATLGPLGQPFFVDAPLVSNTGNIQAYGKIISSDDLEAYSRVYFHSLTTDIPASNGYVYHDADGFLKIKIP